MAHSARCETVLKRALEVPCKLELLAIADLPLFDGEVIAGRHEDAIRIFDGINVGWQVGAAKDLSPMCLCPSNRQDPNLVVSRVHLLGLEGHLPGGKHPFLSSGSDGAGMVEERGERGGGVEKGDKWGVDQGGRGGGRERRGEEG